MGESIVAEDLDRKERARLRSRKYYLANRDKADAAKKKHRDENRDRINAANRKWAHTNVEKIKAKNKRWYAQNASKVLARKKERQAAEPDRLMNLHYRRRYGFSIKRYDEMLEAQGHKCALCGAAPGSRRLHADHCHTTGHVRGLLCFSCNSSLGGFQDNADLLRKAADYLDAHVVGALGQLNCQSEPGIAEKPEKF